jgi:hypothetical protein
MHNRITRKVKPSHLEFGVSFYAPVSSPSPFNDIYISSTVSDLVFQRYGRTNMSFGGTLRGMGQYRIALDRPFFKPS